MNPELRFKDQDGKDFPDWEEKKLSDVYKRIRNAFVGTATPYYVDYGHFYLESNNVKDGKINRNSEIFINDFFYEKQKEKWLHTGDIVMVQSGHVGHTAVIPNELDNTAAHALIMITNPYDEIDSYYINYYFQTNDAKRKIDNITKGNTIKHILASDVKMFNMDFCNVDEQEKVAKLLGDIDKRIETQAILVEKLKNTKEAVLVKMFPQGDSKVPEIRFDGFSGDWEEKLLGKELLIQRGGSPRPIEKYITNNSNGVNWIKIGDAPAGGNRITKVNEKIIEEGVKHSRSVYKGDLILSNSMSFGRPYILEVDGCIHDGWLLLRDEKQQFDLAFLCEVLGSNMVFHQYVSLAAGSTVNNLNKNLVSGVKIIVPPSKKEQEIIGKFFEKYDKEIEINQKKYEKLCYVKKALLHKMFPTKGDE